MSAKPTQVLRVVSDTPSKFEIYRELEFLHQTLNQRLVDSDQEDLTTDYEAGDLGTAAEIATALNATNTAINAILAKIRQGS